MRVVPLVADPDPCVRPREWCRRRTGRRAESRLTGTRHFEVDHLKPTAPSPEVPAWSSGVIRRFAAWPTGAGTQQYEDLDIYKRLTVMQNAAEQMRMILSHNQQKDHEITNVLSRGS